ncbi:MAG TPA: DNA-processing protein DprA [Ktedonobacteraceae bacterium]|nr:DNA-processing protein DprA [Ktedonobacteraceae bacterium]
MMRDLREQACWLLLAFESGLPIRIINDILVSWCVQSKRSLQEFFAASSEEWIKTCHLNAGMIEKLEKANEKLVGQAFLVEQLAHNSISLLTVLDDDYPKLLKTALKRDQTPPVLFYAGNLRILERKTIAIIGSRNAGEESLAFTRAVAQYLATQGANVISGNARGVDRTAYEGATNTDGCTTVVLPHGIRKLSRVQMQALLPKIEAGKVLLVSQFHPDAQWVVSRAMERNKVVTGLAQIVIVAESDVQGGTWAGANGALKQHRPLYVRKPELTSSLPGNKALIELGGHPLPWPTDALSDVLSPLLVASDQIRQKQNGTSTRPSQLSLLALSNE